MGNCDVKVTVICLVFNHEKYLEKCLCGFAEQKTAFPFEVIVHDDASTDGSVDIIKEYCRKYPDIFVPILEETNQYSKGIRVSKGIIDNAKSDYIAFCEGDDYWCDPNKLQKQYDYMQEHRECSMCVHNTIVHDLSGKEPDTRFWTDDSTLFESGYMSVRQIFDSWTVHTSSYFIRNSYEIKPEWATSYFLGDYVYLTVARAHGMIGVLRDAMSVYNSNNPEGLTARNINSTGFIKKLRERGEYLSDYLSHFPDVDDEIKTVATNRMNAIDEYTAAREFMYQMQATASDSTKTDLDKFEWLVNMLNSELIHKYCTNPSQGTETVMSGEVVRILFNLVGEFAGSLRSLGATIHFSFVSWLVRMYRTADFPKELILAVSAAPENSAGWGANVKGDPEHRKAVVLQYASESNLTGEQVNELNSLKSSVKDCVENGNYKQALEEVLKGLDISDLSKELIYYKALILNRLGDRDACLDEVGIYTLFYGLDENIKAVYNASLKVSGA